MIRREWSWTAPDGTELRLMRLPDRQNLQLVLVDDDGMHQIARTLNDRAATALAAWLDEAIGSQA
ncbi:MAG: hypothetical protein ACRDZO_27975 [Egibacteraceae bacterium]